MRGFLAGARPSGGAAQSRAGYDRPGAVHINLASKHLWTPTFPPETVKSRRSVSGLRGDRPAIARRRLFPSTKPQVTSSVEYCQPGCAPELCSPLNTGHAFLTRIRPQTRAACYGVFLTTRAPRGRPVAGAAHGAAGALSLAAGRPVNSNRPSRPGSPQDRTAIHRRLPCDRIGRRREGLERREIHR